MFGQQRINVGGAATGVQALVQADPVGPITLAAVVPLGVVAGGQGQQVGRGGLGPVVVKLLFVVAQFMKAPQVAVVVAVVDLGVGEVCGGQLVALQPGLRHIRQGQARHLGRAGLALRQQG